MTQQETIQPLDKKRTIDWTVIVFLTLTHAMAIACVYYAMVIHFSWWSLGLAAVYALFSCLSITGGYHRLFSHRTYKAHPVLELFYLIFGAAAAQHSALKWSLDHRRHHAVTDQEDDPYNAKKGFWWSHIVWLLFKTPHSLNIKATDLQNNPRVMWQHNNYIYIFSAMLFVVPLLLGLLWGDPLGALLWVTGVRLTLLYHCTWSINSWAHKIGTQPYSDKTTARDSPVTALLALGEGYHNYHHHFQYDYRNGIKWYQFDPTKWFIKSLEKIRMTSDLKRTPQHKIDEAVLAMKQKKAAANTAGL